jgi:DNA-3-methyladenine glycosylase I
MYEVYHDTEWGVPVYDDQKLFEFIVLESAQAGLSWAIILKKREGYRKAFAKFNPKKVAKFGAREVARLMQNSDIVRNRLKIEATIANAKAFLEIQKEFGSFAVYMWGFVGNKPIVHAMSSLKEYPKYIPEAEVFAKDLKKRGFRFFGPTVAYAHMQAVGMVNDHMKQCFRFTPRP